MKGVLQVLKEDIFPPAWISQLGLLNEVERQAIWRQHLMRVEVSTHRLRIIMNPTGDITPDSVQSEPTANGG